MECTIGNVESVRHIDEGKTKGAAYDTAWVARVTDECGKPLFPECVKWLLENQKPDGSWGCKIQYYHDRVLSTLSAVMALKELGKTRYKEYIQKGETYIWENIENLALDNYRLIGSELLIPSLMEQAESMGLHLPYHVNVYQKEYHAKLKKIDESLWYSPTTTLSFSLEFLGKDVDMHRLPEVQLPDGSVGNSPASTAYFLKYIKDAKAATYLRDALSFTRNGSVMTVYPIDMFEYGWTVYNLMLAGLYLERFTEICDFLFNNIGRQGASWSTLFPIPDADDTAVILKVLHNLQYTIDPSVLKMFYTGKYYLTFTFELDPSISTNIHVLDFVKSFSEFSDREHVIEQLVHFLRREIHPDGFWIDKWHASPYYPTSHAVFALCDIDPSLAERAISWILETQHENGLWGAHEGEYKGTLEETAYAVQALLYYHSHVESIDTRRILMALSALNMKTFVSSLDTLPEMWVAKVLLTPIRVIRSAVASAQLMARVQNLQSAFVACGRWIL
ncbi:MAG: prenyltransferase/squalene oxidase repeat-containing protein [Candidatus Methanofastidiosia archaeon]|jgi:halimadienyl-diphosphate synthase